MPSSGDASLWPNWRDAWTARGAANRHREGSVVGNLGNEYAEMGITDKARLHNEAALAVAREVGNRRLEANTLCNLGLLHQVQGRFAEALDQLEAALAVARDLGDAHLECAVQPRNGPRQPGSLRRGQ